VLGVAPQLVGDAVVVVEILEGLVAVAEIVVYWRSLVCLTPAFVLALVLYFSIPDRLVSLTLAALVLTFASVAASIWERTSRSSRRNRNGN